MYVHELDKARALVKNARGDARDIAQALARELSEARTVTDPELSDAGNQRRRAELVQSKRDLAAKALRVMRSDTDATRKALSEAVVTMIELADEPAMLIRAEQRWNQVKQRLEAGERLPDVIRTADSVTARAIAEHAPSYLMARNSHGRSIHETLGRLLAGTEDTRFTEIVSTVRSQVLGRLAEVNTDATRRTLLATAAESESAFAAAEPWLGAIESMVNGHQVNMLDVAIQDAAVTGSAQRASAESAEGGAGDGS